MTDRWKSEFHDAMARHVDSGQMPGLVALVARGGDVHVEVIGTKDFGDSGPLPRDAIFRIASLTKPVIAVATMMLVDEGVLQLDQPVDDLLPELADRQVLRSLESELDDTVPADRAITVEDLLTFRLGFGAIMAAPGTYPIQDAETELQLATLGPPWPPPPFGPDEWIRRFGTLPLLSQPGESWMYNTGAQVLGVLVERATKTPLADALQERLFGPLGMHDTAFFVPASKRDRLTTAYAPDPETGEMRVLDAVETSYWNAPPAMPNAAGWLVSTIDDFWAFVRLFLYRGRAGDQTLLSPHAIDQMLADRLSEAQRTSGALFLGERGSWGLGLSVPAAGVPPGVPSGIGWDGGTGTTWRSDLDRDVSGILFTQRAMTSPQPPEVFADFWRAAYADA